MRSVTLLLLIVSLQQTVFAQFSISFSFNNIDPTAILDPSVIFGQFMNIGAHVRVQRNARLGSYCNLSPFANIGSGCSMGDYSNVGPKTTIGNNVQVAPYTNIGSENMIGDNCQFDMYAGTGPACKLSNDVQMKQYAQVHNNAEIAPGCMLDEYSAVGPHAKLDEGAYMGQYCSAGANSNIGKDAVVHKFANIPNGKKVPEKEVVIKTPTSEDLYKECAPPKTLPAVTNMTAVPEDNSTFSELMDDLLHQQNEEVKSQCQSQQQVEQVSLDLLPAIKTVYLIKLHGKDRFDEFEKLVKGGNGYGDDDGNYAVGVIIINGRRLRFANGDENQSNTNKKMLKQQLKQERHFGSDQQNPILNPEQQKKLVNLMAMEQDTQRPNRVQGDTVCQMCQQIQQAQRQGKCDS